MELFEIKKGTKLYRKEFKKYREVEVYEIYLERYINCWKTIIKVIDDNKLIFTHFASDLNSILFTKIPAEKNIKNKNVGDRYGKDFNM